MVANRRRNRRWRAGNSSGEWRAKEAGNVSAAGLGKWWAHFTSLIWHMPGRTGASMIKSASVAIWAQIGSGIIFSVLMMGYGLVIWKGPWPAGMAGKQLDLLGQGQLISGSIVLVALVAIAGLRLGMKATRQGFDLSAERDDGEDHKTVIETTITQPASPPAPPPIVATTVTESVGPAAKPVHPPEIER